MNKKNILGITALAAYCLVASALAGCKKSEGNKLEEQIAKMQLPMEINDNTTLTQCYFADNTLVFRNDVAPEVWDSLNVDSMKSKTIQQLKVNLNSQQLVSYAVKAQASIKYIYANGSDSVTFTISPGELSDGDNQ